MVSLFYLVNMTNIYILISCVMLIFWGVKLYYMSILTYCTSKRRLDGKTVLITGGSKGIGYYTALDIARRGARVIITSSDIQLSECKTARDKIIADCNNKNIVVKYLDLRSLECVRNFAEDILENETRLDVLINNAGTVGFGNNFSEDGLLMGLQVNYFGPFLLTHLLIDLIKKTKQSRIVNVASNYSQLGIINLNNINRCPTPIFLELAVYGLSKKFVVYMTWEFAARLKDYGITVNCVHTGYVATDIWNKKFMYTFITKFFQKALFKTPKQGAQCPIHVAVSEKVEGITGKYFDECKPYRPYIKKDYKTIKTVWDKSIELVKLKPEEINI